LPIIVHNFPDQRVFPLCETPASWPRNACSLSLLYCGTVTEHYDLGLAVKAIARLAGEVPVRLRIVGAGNTLGQVFNLARSLGVAESIELIGLVPLDRVHEEMRKADVGISCHRAGIFGDLYFSTKIIEYLTQSLPVITPQTYTVSKYVPSDCVFYFEPGNDAALADVIRFMWRNPVEVLRRLTRAKQLLPHLSWQAEKGKFLAFYTELLNDASPTARIAIANDSSGHVDLLERSGGQIRRNVQVYRGDDRHFGKSAGGYSTTRAKEGDMNGPCNHPRYVLISPARNEEAFIEKTIESVISQTIPPIKWVIVDDGSTDKTAEIVRRYLARHSWIEMVQMPQRRDRSFAAKVHAFNAGFERVKNLDYEIVGNLDADLSFDADYFEFILGKFTEDPNLGVAGTVFKEEGYSSEKQSFEGHKHVAGGCQLFRKRCLEEVGGFKPNEGGGVDWIAVTTARMMGWKTKSFRQKSFFHHRHLGTAERGAFAAMFFYGEKDYYFGGHPIWELFRVFYRMTKPPYVIAGLGLGLGYMWATLRRKKRPVTKELVKFHRKEQMEKLSAILKSLLTLKPIDSFTVLPE